MKKLMVLILSTLMLLSCGKPGEVSNKNKIGITQIATHPSLDKLQSG